MKLTVIGFRGAYPGENQATSCYLLEEEGYSLLLDCGSGSLMRLPAYLNKHELNGLVISHYHADHIADFGVYCHAALVDTSLNLRKAPLLAWGPEDPETPFALTYRDVVLGEYYQPGVPLKAGPFTLTFSANVHPCVSCAIRVESGKRALVYTGDTQWYDGLADFCGDADLLIAEASLYNEFFGMVEGHLTAGEAGKLAARARCGALFLTHLPHYGNHEDLLREALEAAEKESGGSVLPVTLAGEGLFWEEQ